MEEPFDVTRCQLEIIKNLCEVGYEEAHAEQMCPASVVTNLHELHGMSEDEIIKDITEIYTFEYNRKIYGQEHE